MYNEVQGLSSKLNEQKSKLNGDASILESVASRHKHKLRELLDWLKEEKGLNPSQLAARSGKFGKTALTYLVKSEEPNPTVDVIHGIAKVAGIPEQAVIDACLGRPFHKQKLEMQSIKEIFRKYEMIRPENRPESLDVTITILTNLIEETLEAQEQKNAKR